MTLEYFIRDGSRVLVYFSSDNNPSNLTVSVPATTGQYTVTFEPKHTINLPDAIYEYGVIVRDGSQIVYAGGGDVEVVTPGGLPK